MSSMDEYVRTSIDNIVDGWLRAKNDEHNSVYKFTGTDFSRYLASNASGICRLTPIDDQYEILREAFTSETELIHKLDKLSGWFLKQERWTIYQHTKAVFRSMNRILNDYGSDRKLQYMFIILSLEITIAKEKENENV